MQIPIMNGIYTDASAEFRTSYPMNLVPVPKQTGLSKGYLRTADGMVEFSVAAYSGAADRGAINWNGICYRVIGEWLTRVNEDQTIDYLGTVENDGQRVAIVNSFDRLAVASAGRLYYWAPTGGGVQPVSDTDLGVVRDIIWISGYFMTTDGEHLVVTELADPTSVNPLKYGSSEASPDPVKGLLNIRNEAYAINRYTTEVFQNVGGTGFPFQRIQGAMISKGAVGTQAKCYFLESFAFVGGGANEAPSVYIGAAGGAQKIATREVETLLSELTDEELADIAIESRADKLQQLLYVHLPDKTLVYDATGTAVVGEPLWHVLTSGASGDMPYRARNYCLAYGKWLFGDLQSQKVGYFTQNDARQFGETVPWQFDTPLIYNESAAAILHSLELVRLPGRQAVSPESPAPTQAASIFLSYSDDGLTWSNPRPSPISTPGQYGKRTAWQQLGRMAHWRGLRFRGMNNPYPDAFARLEANLEPLAV